jgi:large subunit ribosomal protein L19
MAADKTEKKAKAEKADKAEKPARESVKTDTMNITVPFKIGDSVNVHVKIYEGGKERIQTFSGSVISRKGSGPTENFTVRRISHGVGVERIFPVHSPHIAKVEIEGSSKVRRAKLYYLRNITGKKAKLKSRAATEG